ncbi:hypothetical protein TWF730_000917 [Orbilia blumenaviensis]|uniref:F-box domain-containing protein n=1 Tax=Orbilia blumenaviensis TaxID=1796055 RepID=A0AAV9VN25_9PEZI
MESNPSSTIFRVGPINLNMHSSIFSLPTEILTEIFSYFPASSDLASICRVNKLFNQIATPMLYHNVHLNYVSIFNDISEILRCFLQSELEEEHPGIKFIRNLRISEGRPRPNDSEDYEEDREEIREDIANLLSKIRPNQLSSLRIETSDFEEFYEKNLGEQNNLKSIQVRFTPEIKREAITILHHYRHLIKDPTSMLSISNLEIDLGPMAITKFEIKPKKSDSLLRPIGITATASLLPDEYYEENLQPPIWSTKGMISLIGDPGDKGFYLEELDTEIPDFVETEQTLSPELLKSLGQLRKLTLRSYNPVQLEAIAVSTFPLATNLTDLRLYYTEGQQFLNDCIETFPCKLKVLYIIQKNSLAIYIAPKALMPHAQTLETLWLENLEPDDAYPSRTLPLAVLRNPTYLDWSILISKRFPKLREVAVSLDSDSVEEGLVGENFQILRVLNEHHFRCTCGHSIKRLAESAFGKLYEREPSPKLKAIAFGTPNRGLSCRKGPDYEEVSIYFGRREKDMLDRDVARCTPLNARQARYMLPEVTIIMEGERTLVSLEK